jgi:hypothetical protein
LAVLAKDPVRPRTMSRSGASGERRARQEARLRARLRQPTSPPRRTCRRCRGALGAARRVVLEPLDDRAPKTGDTAPGVFVRCLVVLGGPTVSELFGTDQCGIDRPRGRERPSLPNALVPPLVLTARHGGGPDRSPAPTIRARTTRRASPSICARRVRSGRVRES